MRGLELRKAATYQTPRTGAESVILSIWRSDRRAEMLIVVMLHDRPRQSRLDLADRHTDR